MPNIRSTINELTKEIGDTPLSTLFQLDTSIVFGYFVEKHRYYLFYEFKED